MEFSATGALWLGFFIIALKKGVWEDEGICELTVRITALYQSMEAEKATSSVEHECWNTLATTLGRKTRIVEKSSECAGKWQEVTKLSGTSSSGGGTLVVDLLLEAVKVRNMEI
ncbi:hypothetical protein HOY80DRAFT_1032076 [Tuber brumale]|nr:hypothetical protein HOY80DRAFT_1032076 [Tuber brumale]